LAEEQYPIFKSSGEAFDRAKVESDIAKSGGSSITPEIGDSMREADKAYKEASDFYNQIFKDEIKGLDPAYDPNSINYTYAYSPASTDKRKIKKSIEKGEEIDGKDIVPIAKESAASKVKNATALKVGSVTQIVETVGIKTIKNDMEGFEKIQSDFNSKVQDEDLKFEKLLDNLQDILGLFRDPQPGQQNLLYTPENNAIISALAKILSEEGFNSDSVKFMSAKYEEYVDSLSSKVKSNSIESVSQAGKEQKPQESASVTTSEQKIEEKTAAGEKLESQQTTDLSSVKSEAVAVTKEQGITESVETPKQSSIESASTPETKNEIPTSTSSTPKAIESTPSLASPKTAPTSTQGEFPTGEPTGQKESTSKKGSSFIEEMFGGLLSSTESQTPTFTSELKTLTESLESSQVAKPLTESMSKGVESNTPSVTTNVGGLSSASKGAEKSSTRGMVKSVEKIQEKIGASPETMSKVAGIKETVTQKLSSPVQPEITSTDNKNTQTPSTGQGVTSTEGKTESSSATSEGKTEEVSKQSPMSTSSEEPKDGKGNEDLSNKMGTMISLLSQLNDTLSGPLLVTSTTKKFD
jgi:hypothetical protein